MSRSLIVVGIASILLAGRPALAQQQAPRLTAVGILSGEIAQLAGQDALNREQIAALQEQLAVAQARIKQLEGASQGQAAPAPQ